MVIFLSSLCTRCWSEDLYFISCEKCLDFLLGSNSGKDFLFFLIRNSRKDFNSRSIAEKRLCPY